MTRSAIRIIRDEHLVIGAVVYALRQVVRRARDGEPADFRLLHAILDYIVEYPDRWHHPKEDRWLFPAVQARDATAAGLIAELEEEHAVGEQLIEELKHGLLRWEHGEPGALALFVAAVEHYARFQWDHIRKEEDQLLPIAEHVLGDDDWQRIGAAFEANDNPLFGIRPKDEAETLYRRILALAPMPVAGTGRR